MPMRPCVSLKTSWMPECATVPEMAACELVTPPRSSAELFQKSLNNPPISGILCRKAGAGGRPFWIDILYPATAVARFLGRHQRQVNQRHQDDAGDDECDDESRHGGADMPAKAGVERPEAVDEDGCPKHCG